LAGKKILGREIVFNLGESGQHARHAGKLVVSDKAFDEQAGSAASTDSITVPMLANGRFVARLTPNPGPKAVFKK
jgi:hypothetical protein